MLNIMKNGGPVPAFVIRRHAGAPRGAFAGAPGSVFLAMLLVVVGAGTPEAALAGIFSGCQGAKERCGLISGSCCGSMSCELTAWPPECRHAPPREGEACTIFSGCAGSDLYCKGFQDGLAGRCTRYSRLGEECDGIITLCGDGMACTQDARYPDVSAHPFKGRCYPQAAAVWPWDDDEACLDSYSEKIHKNLPMGSGQYPAVELDGIRAMTFGSGAALAVVAGGSFEKGGVYSYDGTYACYLSTCVMWEGNAEFSAFSSIGQYETYGDFESDGYAAYAGAGVVFGASRATVWDLDPDDVSASVVGDTFSVSFGIDFVPITAGVSYCTTEVNKVIEDWKVITGPKARCSDRTVCAEGPTVCTADVSIDAGSEGSDGQPPSLEQTPPGPYPIGETAATLRASDSTGAYDECSALIDVNDCTPPVLTCQPTVAECQAERSAFVEPVAPVVEECTAYSVVGPPAQDYPLGRTPVQFTATDAYSNTSSCETSVTVSDTKAPEIVFAAAHPAVLWPPDHKMQRVEIQIEAVDACDPDASCVVSSIESSEPDRVWWRRKDQAHDGRILGPTTVELRAERSGSRSSRSYTVRFECTDTTAGNVSSGEVRVVVPHDQARR